MNAMRTIWQVLRAVCGDDAYERYLLHRKTRHLGEPPMDRKAFYLDNEHRRWDGGLQRCC